MSHMPASAVHLSPFPSDETASDHGTENTCLTDVGLTNLARGCKGLEKLSLIWCSTISSTGLVRLAENCKNLTSLDLQACYIGDIGLVAIGEGRNLLNNLNLRFVEGTTDEGLKRTSKAPVHMLYHQSHVSVFNLLLLKKRNTVIGLYFNNIADLLRVTCRLEHLNQLEPPARSNLG